MVNDNNSSLLEIYQNFLDEAENLESEIKENDFTISETEDYLEQLYNQESDDYKVFSPRNILIKQKEIIEENKVKIDKLKNTNIYLNERLKKVKLYLNDLEIVICKAECMKDTQPDYRVADELTKERKRIAEDLHDSILQDLTHLTYMVEITKKYLDQDVSRAKQELDSINDKIRLLMDELRNSIYHIHPLYLNELGFQKSIDKFLNEIREIHPEFFIKSDLDVDNFTNESVQTTIFRIIQEAVNNAVEHSGGNLLLVTLKEKSDNYKLIIKDNGKGFNYESLPESNHYGLSIMKERTKLLGGSFNLESTNEGTEISIIIPTDKAL